MAETIDFVLQKLVATGAPKDDAKPGETCHHGVGSWSIHKPHGQFLCANEVVFSHLHKQVAKRLEHLHLVREHGSISVVFDPVTRRIEAVEIFEHDCGGILLTLYYWPGLEQAEKLCASTIHQWHQAIANGWFDGI